MVYEDCLICGCKRNDSNAYSDKRGFALPLCYNCAENELIETVNRRMLLHGYWEQYNAMLKGLHDGITDPKHKIIEAIIRENTRKWIGCGHDNEQTTTA